MNQKQREAPSSSVEGHGVQSQQVSTNIFISPPPQHLVHEIRRMCGSNCSGGKPTGTAAAGKLKATASPVLFDQFFYSLAPVHLKQAHQLLREHPTLCTLFAAENAPVANSSTHTSRGKEDSLARSLQEYLNKIRSKHGENSHRNAKKLDWQLPARFVLALLCHDALVAMKHIDTLLMSSTSGSNGGSCGEHAFELQPSSQSTGGLVSSKSKPSQQVDTASPVIHVLQSKMFSENHLKHQRSRSETPCIAHHMFSSQQLQWQQVATGTMAGPDGQQRCRSSSSLLFPAAQSSSTLATRSVPPSVTSKQTARPGGDDKPPSNDIPLLTDHGTSATSGCTTNVVVAIDADSPHPAGATSRSGEDGGQGLDLSIWRHVVRYVLKDTSICCVWIGEALLDTKTTTPPAVARQENETLAAAADEGNHSQQQRHIQQDAAVAITTLQQQYFHHQVSIALAFVHFPPQFQDQVKGSGTSATTTKKGTLTTTLSTATIEDLNKDWDWEIDVARLFPLRIVKKTASSSDGGMAHLDGGANSSGKKNTTAQHALSHRSVEVVDVDGGDQGVGRGLLNQAQRGKGGRNNTRRQQGEVPAARGSGGGGNSSSIQHILVEDDVVDVTIMTSSNSNKRKRRDEKEEGGWRRKHRGRNVKQQHVVDVDGGSSSDDVVEL